MNKSTGTTWLAHPQSKLGAIGLIGLLVITSLVTPLSLDMYTPALPHMTEYFSTSVDTVNLTLVGYFLFFAIGLLIFGPISDKYGRRKVLLGGIVTYTISSALCALSPTIEFLIAARVLQALGAGAVSAVSTAVVKDAVVPEKREMILSVVQVMFVIGPVLAPVIGALVIQFADWHMTFWILAGIGLFCTVLALLFEETLPLEERYAGTVFGSVKQLGTVAKNKGFSSFLLIVGLFNLPFMAYIAVASYVYISFFGLTELEYSFYFALAAGISVLGPVIWLGVSRFISARRFTSILISIAFITGAAMVVVGGVSPVLFFLTFLVFAICEACIRPYSTNILLSQREDDTGAASSLINFAHTAIGCLGMLVAVFPWPNYAMGIGVIIAATMVVAGLLWFFFLRSPIPLKGIKDELDQGNVIQEGVAQQLGHAAEASAMNPASSPVGRKTAYESKSSQ